MRQPIPSPTTSPQRRLSADYYPLVARAVASLATGGDETRAAIYERTRRALLRHLDSMEQPFTKGEIAAELRALEDAIGRVEAQAGATAPTKRTPPAPRVAAPRPSAQEPAAQRPARANPIKLASGPVILGSALLCAFLIYGPFGDPTTPASAELAGLVLWTSVLSFALLSIVTAWHQRRRLREAGLVKHRVSAFASRSTSEEACREVASRLDDQALFWAYFLPEHGQQAKTIVREELERRGCSRTDIESWSPAPREVAVPPAVEKAVSPERYASLMRFKRWLFNAYLVLMLLTAMLLVFITYDLYSLGQLRNLGSVVPVLAIFLWIVAGLSAMPFRNRALRILLLRPFGERKMTRALKRFVCRNVGRAGNVFTLSDRNYKPNLLITLLLRVPAEGFDLLALLMLGPLIRSSKRVATVRRESKFRKLERHLLRKATPAFWSFLAGDQAFNIRSSDDWWQMCIHMLMHSCEIIVVDLSKVKEGTEWELDELHANKMLAKCVFVVGEDNVPDVRPVLERNFAGDQWPTVHVYRNDGTLADRREFDARLGEVMQSGLAGWGNSGN
jgi:hypothetical protein